MKIFTDKSIELMTNAMKDYYGDHYEEVKEFFENVIASKCPNKVLVTRRSYVLYKIFEILSGTQVERHGMVYNTHSLPLVRRSSDEDSILIIDDIVVSGKTIENIIETLKKAGWKEEHINVWCLRCTDDAERLDYLDKFFRHVVYATRYQAKIFSDMLTDIIVASNIGFVSYVNSYRLNDMSWKTVSNSGTVENYNLNEYLLKTLHNNDQPDEDQIDEKKLEEQITAQVVWGGTLLDATIIEKYDILPCVRLYGRRDDESLTAIPYVFLPALNIEHAYNYLISLLTDLTIKIPSFFVGPTRRKDAETIVLFYKWTVMKVSWLVLERFVQEYSSNYNSIILPLLECSESFPDFKECSVAEPAQFEEVEKKWFLEKNEIENSDLSFCRGLLSRKLSEQKNESFNKRPFEAAYLDYLYSIRDYDEKRIDSGMNRYIGLQVSDVAKVFEKYPKQQVLAAMIESWDKGESSYIIETIKDNKDAVFVTGLVRHGEQSYRSHFKAFSDVYPYFYLFFLQTYETSQHELNLFARYFDNISNRFTLFVTGLGQKNYLPDIMSITPESVGSLMSEGVKSAVSSYVQCKYKK